MQSEPSDQQLVKRIAAVYRQCRSYRDIGRITVTRVEGSDTTVKKAEFVTVFIRDVGFRFEFRWDDGSPRPENFAIRSYEGEVATLTRGAWRKEPSLAEAVAALTGLTAGASLHVPNLLLPNVGAPSVLKKACHSRIEDVRVEGEDCYQFTCVDETRGRRMTLAVERRRLLVRRLTQWMDLSKLPWELPSGRPEAGDGVAPPRPRWQSMEAVYRPELNGPVGVEDIKRQMTVTN